MSRFSRILEAIVLVAFALAAVFPIAAADVTPQKKQKGMENVSIENVSGYRWNYGGGTLPLTVVNEAGTAWEPAMLRSIAELNANQRWFSYSYRLGTTRSCDLKSEVKKKKKASRKHKHRGKKRHKHKHKRKHSAKRGGPEKRPEDFTIVFCEDWRGEFPDPTSSKYSMAAYPHVTKKEGNLRAVTVVINPADYRQELATDSARLDASIIHEILHGTGMFLHLQGDPLPEGGFDGQSCLWSVRSWGPNPTPPPSCPGSADKRVLEGLYGPEPGG